jgi:DNA processing protein
LLDTILANGAAVTEMPLGWEPRARDFPRRNRLVSGLAAGVVIVEAAKRSGSLITARLALEQGREVFAVPGSPLDPRAEGTNGLLKQGATLVTEPSDIVSVLEPILGCPLEQSVQQAQLEPSDFDGDYEVSSADTRARILGLLSSTPVAMDDLIRLSGLPAALVRTLLLELEIAGWVSRQDGGQLAVLRRE